MAGGIQNSQNHPPITAEDLVNLGVKPQLIPLVVSMTLRAEKSPNGSLLLSPAEAKILVEVLDKVVSSNLVNRSLRNRCLRVLQRISHSHGILPKSYHPNGVTLSDAVPYASGGFADIWKGHHDRNRVCVKAFKTKTAVNLEKIKRRFYPEIIGWKYVSHRNVLPFLGVSETLFSFCIITPWLKNGNIIEYTRRNQRVNRLQLLAQATCGLKYLHSISIVHSDINPGNILIAKDGTACLGDFRITSVITHRTVVEPGSTTKSKPGLVRYMAPEVLNPWQTSLSNSNLSKESDVYSLAMTAYETLTELLPYGNDWDFIIVFRVVTGARPPRPPNARWLKDQIWDMIKICWSEKRELRWDVSAVYNQFSALSIHGEGRSPPEPPKPPVQQQTAKPKLAASTTLKKRRLRTMSTLSTIQREPLKRQSSWPGLSALSTISQTGGENNRPRPGFIKRARRSVMSLPGRGWNLLLMVLKAVSRFKKLLKRRLGQLRQEALRFPLKPSLSRPPTNRSSREGTANKILDLTDKIASAILHGSIGPPAGTKIEPPKGKQQEFTDWDSKRPQERPQTDQVKMRPVSPESLLESFESKSNKKLFNVAGLVPGTGRQPSQELINNLDKMLEEGKVPLKDQPEFLNKLGKLCRQLNTIPDSMRIGHCPNGQMDEGYEGGNATVFRSEYQGRPVAVKTLRVYLTSDFEECFGKFRREVIAWRHLKHPNILPFIGVNLERHRLAMVSEWMDNGNINEFIKKHQDANRVQLLVDAATGLEYMHSIHMVHGDLKGVNILVSQSCRACLADFGLSTIIGIGRRAADNPSVSSATPEASLMSFTTGGTPRWMSPELLDPDRFGITDCRPTKQSDCYALGMVVYEVLYGKIPYWNIWSIGGVIIAIMKGDRPQKPQGAEDLGFTEGLWRIIERCWLVKASERPDVKDVLSQLKFDPRGYVQFDRRRDRIPISTPYDERYTVDERLNRCRK